MLRVAPGFICLTLPLVVLCFCNASPQGPQHLDPIEPSFVDIAEETADELAAAAAAGPLSPTKGAVAGSLADELDDLETF